MDALADFAQLLAHDRAGTGQRLLQELLRQAGGVKREQGRLCTAAGNPLHQEIGLLHMVQRAINGAVALFDGDRVIVSTGAAAAADGGAVGELAIGGAASEADGVRPIGTRAPEEAAGFVLGRGQAHEAREIFGGREWYSSYVPLRGTNGDIYGMTAVFLPFDDLRAGVQALRPALEGPRPHRPGDEQRRAAAHRVIQRLDRTTTRLRIVALNAAIISARFGQRTGFDVVAGEMGKLTAEVRELLGTVEAALLGEDVHDPALPPASGARDTGGVKR